MNTMKNDNLEIVTGEAHIQELADYILDNNLYVSEKTLNYLISVTAQVKTVQEYQRYIRYSLLKENGEPVALCMLVEQFEKSIVDEVKGLHYFTDSFFSVFVKETHRGKNYGDLVTKSLADNWDSYLREVFMTQYNRFCILADKRGANYARKFFTVPVVCGEFPTCKGLRRIVSIAKGEPICEEIAVSKKWLDTAKTIRKQFWRAYQCA
ncbi:hypothetical protein [Pseudoalteromonas umbrosa]|uniref:hypothetical protein n=1 Tax=Pseudoalteromonas umbrosa TaxID=3048489 RepID=UPI0024C277BA|nr:hypothetical protein [Pseudoalteromonas sp. B95]MDK1290250.1 hypothetical protein [Pseudoalteromonas sp. B95]